MRIAVCRYPLQTLTGFSAFAEKQAILLQEVVNRGATLAVLPEYLALWRCFQSTWHWKSLVASPSTFVVI